MPQQTEKIKKAEPLRPMDMGLCDAHMFKVKVAHPLHGGPFQPIIYSVVDVATRALVGWSVALDPGAPNLLGALRHAAEGTSLCGWNIGGVFAFIQVDQSLGSMDECTPILARIGTHHKVTTVACPSGHWLSEKIKKQVWGQAAESLGQKTHEETYSLDRRNMLFKESRTTDGELLPTWEQFLRVCEEAFEEYNLQPNESLASQSDPWHLSPVELWEKHSNEGWNMDACQLNVDDLDLLFMPSVFRGVQRGSITLYNRRYHNAKLESLEGAKVEVAFCPEDPETVWVWDETKSFVCAAKSELSESHHLFLSDIVKKAREKRAKRRAEIIALKLAEAEVEGFREQEETI